MWQLWQSSPRNPLGPPSSADISGSTCSHMKWTVSFPRWVFMCSRKKCQREIFGKPGSGIAKLPVAAPLRWQVVQSTVVKRSASNA